MRLTRHAAVGLVLMACTGAWAAEPGKPTLVVFDLEAKGATALEAQAVTLGIVRGLRELDVFQVLSSEDIRQLLAIERSRQLFGSEATGINLAKPLGARLIVAGSVSGTPDKLQVEVRLLDTQTTTVLSQKSLGPVRGMEAVARELPTVAAQLVASRLQGEQGTLLVHAREEGAEVVLDDVLVASTPMATPLKVARGPHRLQVRKDGFVSQLRTLRVQAGQLTVEEVTLAPSADYAEAYRERHGRLRIGAYLTTALAVAALGSAIAIDRAATEPTYQREFLPRQSGLRGEYLPEALAGDSRAEGVRQQCVLTPAACRAELQKLEGSLRAQQIATWSLAVVGVAAAGTSTYLWLSGKDPNRYTGLVASLSVGEGEGAFVLAGRF